MTKMSLEELAKSFKGTGGSEKETVLVDCYADRGDGYVTVWSNKSDVSKIVKRCEKSIIDYEIRGDGILFYIDRKSFRGVVSAFKVSTSSSKRSAASEARAERMKQYWAKKKLEKG